MSNRKEYKRKYRAEHKKEIAEYARKYYRGHRDHIKEHSSNYGKIHLSEITKKRRASRKKYGALHRRELSEQRLRTRHGITLEDYAYMYRDQKGCCAICNTPEGELKKCLRVDHDHKTGKVRGLLCDRCNVGLGCFRDACVLLHMASNYISRRQNI